MGGWRDGSMLVGSVAYRYDATGFVDQVEHWSSSGLRNPKPGQLRLWSTRRFRRLDGGARVTETTQPGKAAEGVTAAYTREAEYRFFVRGGAGGGGGAAGGGVVGTGRAVGGDGARAAVTAESWKPSPGLSEALPLETAKQARLCLCPQNDESLCVLGPRPFCVGDSPQVAHSLGPPEAQSCLACGERVEVHVRLTGSRSFTRKEVWHVLPTGVRFAIERGNRKLKSEGSYHYDAARGGLVTRQGPRPEQFQKLRPWGKPYCAANPQVECSYDPMGNLLEVSVRSRNSGKVVSRTAYSYDCHERSKP
jgi:hypothetical protein